MRDRIVKLLIVTLLFVSMEGFADSVDETSFHQTHHAHTESGGNQWFPDTDGDDHSSVACEHFCHAHAVALTEQLSFEELLKFNTLVPLLPACTIAYDTAPPTPPPNL